MYTFSLTQFSNDCRSRRTDGLLRRTTSTSPGPSARLAQGLVPGGVRTVATLCRRPRRGGRRCHGSTTSPEGAESAHPARGHLRTKKTRRDIPRKSKPGNTQIRRCDRAAPRGVHGTVHGTVHAFEPSMAAVSVVRRATRKGTRIPSARTPARIGQHWHSRSRAAPLPFPARHLSEQCKRRTNKSASRVTSFIASSQPRQLGTAAEIAPEGVRPLLLCGGLHLLRCALSGAEI